MNSSTLRQVKTGSSFRRALQILAVSLGVLLLCLPGFAQSNLGRIFGATTDQTGGAIVGAAVSVIDVARGITRPLVTDSAGQYDASSLIPGMYTVRAEAKGFKVSEHTDIDVGVGKEIRVDLVLQPGEQTTTVTVTGELPLINTSNAQLGGTLENITVSELPVNGRNYQYLAFTRPGIVMAPTEGQMDFTTDGMNVIYVLWMIDGVSDSNLIVGGPSMVGGAETAPAGGLDEQTILPIDAIQEVNMIENPGAEYGDKSGAHIDVGLKSGTNVFHGTATAFGRDDKLNAKNPFLTSTQPKAPLTMEQYGGTVGGPIKRDKVFFFTGYEGQRYQAGVPFLQNQPTVADIAPLNTCVGQPGNSCAGVATTFSIPDALSDLYNNHGIAPSPLSLNLGGCSALTAHLTGGSITNTPAFTPAQLANMPATAAGIVPFCSPNPLINIFGNGNVPGNGLGPGQIVTDFITNGGSDNGLIKIDVHPDNRNSLYFDWYSGGGDTTSAGRFSQQYYSADFHTWANMGRAVWIFTPNATWLNEFRLGYDYGNFPDYPHECDVPGSGPTYQALGFISGARVCSYESGGPGHDIWPAFPLLTVTGFATTGGSDTYQDNFEHYYSILDNVSWTHGTHNIKFGTEIRIAYATATALQFKGGTLNFGNSFANAYAGAPPLESYLAGVVGNGVLLNGDPNRNEFVPTMEFYIQDSWRATRRLTINYGLRYEYTWPWTNPSQNPSAPGTPPQPAHLWANFNPSLGTATDLIQETPGHPVYAIYPWNFGPRVGVAWDVFGDGKTVLHVGAAVMHDSAPQGLQVLRSAELGSIPTGFTFFDAANTNGINYLGQAAAPPPNTIQTTLASFFGSTTTSALPFTVNTPVYPNAANGAFTCGDGGTYTFNNQQIKPGFCSPQVIAPILHMPYYISYSLSIQHAFTNNFTVDIAYVGNRGSDLAGSINENAPTPGINGAANEQVRRPYNKLFPFYSSISLNSGFANSNYNALQASVTQRLSHGLQFTPGFTWQHELDDTSNEDPYHPHLSYGSSGDPLDFTITATYYIRSIKTPAQLLEGWEVNSTVYVLSGPAATVTDAADDLSGTAQGADHWDILGNPRAFKLGSVGHPVPCYGVAGSSFSRAPNCTTVATLAQMPAICQSGAAAAPTNPAVLAAGGNQPGGIETATQELGKLGCYVVGNPISPLAALFPQAPGTFGTEGTGTIYGKGYSNWDLSLLKNWKFKERFGVQFRAEFFNVLNRTLIFGAGGTSATTPSTFGQITNETDFTNPVIGNGVRKIQFGLKLSF